MKRFAAILYVLFSLVAVGAPAIATDYNCSIYASTVFFGSSTAQVQGDAIAVAPDADPNEDEEGDEDYGAGTIYADVGVAKSATAGTSNASYTSSGAGSVFGGLAPEVTIGFLAMCSSSSTTDPGHWAAASVENEGEYEAGAVFHIDGDSGAGLTLNGLIYGDITGTGDYYSIGFEVQIAHSHLTGYCDIDGGGCYVSGTLYIDNVATSYSDSDDSELILDFIETSEYPYHTGDYFSMGVGGDGGAATAASGDTPEGLPPGGSGAALISISLTASATVTD